MSYPQAPVLSAPPPARTGAALAVGAAVAVSGALIVGVFSGMTSIQSAKVAILLGWLVGLVVSRAGPALRAAAGAGILSAAACAAASVIGLIVVIVRTGHVPLAIVVDHLARVISLMPHVIGWFGFVCWALAAVFGWSTVRSRGRRHSPQFEAAPGARMSPDEGGDQDGGA
jgi:hypothetical protein